MSTPEQPQSPGKGHVDYFDELLKPLDEEVGKG